MKVLVFSLYKAKASVSTKVLRLGVFRCWSEIMLKSLDSNEYHVRDLKDKAWSIYLCGMMLERLWDKQGWTELKIIRIFNEVW